MLALPLIQRQLDGANDVHACCPIPLLWVWQSGCFLDAVLPSSVRQTPWQSIYLDLLMYGCWQRME
jgi:hypothetical protein